MQMAPAARRERRISQTHRFSGARARALSLSLSLFLSRAPFSPPRGARNRRTPSGAMIARSVSRAAAAPAGGESPAAGRRSARPDYARASCCRRLARAQTHDAQSGARRRVPASKHHEMPYY